MLTRTRSASAIVLLFGPALVSPALVSPALVSTALVGSVLLVSPVSAQAAPDRTAPREPQPVPKQADLIAAVQDSQQRITGILVKSLGPTAAAMQIANLAAEAPTPASRYLLYHQALQCASQADARILSFLVDTFAKEFAIDTFDVMRARLQQLAKSRPGRPLDLTLAYLELAHRAARDPRRDPNSQRMDAALAEARRYGLRVQEPKLLEFMRRRTPEIAAIRSRWEQVMTKAPGNLGAGRVLCFLDGDWEDGLPRLAPEDHLERTAIEGKAAKNPDATTCIRVADALLTTAKNYQSENAAEQRLVRRNIRARALSYYYRAWPTASPMQKSRLGRAMTRAEAAIQEGPAPGRLRFRNRGLAQLAVQQCEPRIKDGQLFLASDGISMTRATVRYAFRAIRSVTIRARIHSDRNLNLRFKIGSFNVICNWEVKPESHVYVGDRLVHKTGPLIEKGKEHLVQIRQMGEEAVFFLDGHVVYRGPAQLAGSVTVYPACGSEIAVREVLIDGDLNGQQMLTAPIGKTW